MQSCSAPNLAPIKHNDADFRTRGCMRIKSFALRIHQNSTSAISMDRIDYLDGWRGMAIGFVLLSHFFWYIPGIWRFNFGRFGVDVFFVLSGMLMGRILFIKRTPLSMFYIRRISRILPAFFMYVVFAFMVFPGKQQENYLPEFISTLLFYRTYFSGAPEILQSSIAIQHIWSLNVEEHAYLLLSLLTLPIILRGREYIAIISLAIVALIFDFIYRYQLILGPVHFEVRTECALASILVSSSFCLLFNGMRSKVAPWMPLASFVFALFCYDCHLPWWTRVCVAPFLLAFTVNSIGQAANLFRRILINPLLRLLGIWSFSIYIWQQPFYKYAHKYPEFSLLFLFVAIMVGLFSFYLIESPCRNYLNTLFAARLERGNA